MLCMYVNEKHDNWSEYLPLVEFAYNSAWHASIKMTPFEAMYGYNCLTPPSFLGFPNKVEVSKEMLDKMDEELGKIKKHIKEAQKRQKKFYDLKRRPIEFQVDDMVFLKVNSHRSNLLLGKDHRLSPRYGGRFKVLKKIGSLAYLLELPKHLNVLPVFHVSLFKRYVSNVAHVLQELPKHLNVLELPKHLNVLPVFHVSLFKRYVSNVAHVLQDNYNLKDDGSFELQPEIILDRKERFLRNRSIVEILVKWNSYPVEGKII
ncbi:hypothetical protein KP509_01G054500 [Ceratopteris richardii]|nr:hypothetical protein KP509_01G054500 [Ceratopteris richardii]